MGCTGKYCEDVLCKKDSHDRINWVQIWKWGNRYSANLKKILVQWGRPFCKHTLPSPHIISLDRNITASQELVSFPLSPNLPSKVEPFYVFCFASALKSKAQLSPPLSWHLTLGMLNYWKLNLPGLDTSQIPYTVGSKTCGLLPDQHITRAHLQLTCAMDSVQTALAG